MSKLNVTKILCKNSHITPKIKDRMQRELNMRQELRKATAHRIKLLKEALQLPVKED